VVRPFRPLSFATENKTFQALLLLSNLEMKKLNLLALLFELQQQ